MTTPLRIIVIEGLTFESNSEKTHAHLVQDVDHIRAFESLRPSRAKHTKTSKMHKFAK